MTRDVRQTQHEPAWKRLGLKLKFAQESTDAGQIPITNHSIGHHLYGHAASFGAENTEEPPAKKRRPPEPPHSDANSPRMLTSSFRDRGSVLKKKVAFTAETKDADGDSSKSLLAAQEARDQYIEDLYNEHSAQIQADTQARSDAKMKGTGKTERKSHDQPPRKSRDALDYLSQFHEAKSTWKFNKNREVWILKHALSIAAIPESYNQALAAYIRGLGSQGARSRLLEQCEEVVTRATPDATVEKPGRRQANPEEVDLQHLDKSSRSLEDGGTTPENKSSEHAKDQQPLTLVRARMLLHTVGASTDHADRGALASEDKSLQSSTHAPKIAKKYDTDKIATTSRKKRKNRTAVAEISSSEDDSDSSESEVEQEHARKRRGLTVNMKPDPRSSTVTELDDATSSSAESSSGDSAR